MHLYMFGKSFHVLHPWPCTA